MKPGQVIEIKVDNRYKDGNVRAIGNRLKRNAVTMSIRPIDDPTNSLNPPLLVSGELAEAIKELK